MAGIKGTKKETEQDHEYGKYKNFKEVLVAILIGACVSFLTTLFDGLADFLRAHSENIIGGLIYVAYHVAKNVRV
jgi:hypothetical protein